MQSVWGSKLIMAQTRPHKQTGPYHHHHHPLIISCSPESRRSIRSLAAVCTVYSSVSVSVRFPAALGMPEISKRQQRTALTGCCYLYSQRSPHRTHRQQGGRRDDIDRRRSLPRLTIRRRHPHPHPTRTGPDRHNAFPLSFSHCCLFVTKL